MSNSSSAPKTAVFTPNAPAPAHTFSQGVKKGNMFQVSGQGSVDPTTNQYLGAGDVAEQTRQTLANVLAILKAGGASVEDVIMFRVYLRHRADFPIMNEVYAQFIEQNVPSQIMPSRTTVFTDLPHEVMLVEIDALAVLG